MCQDVNMDLMLQPQPAQSMLVQVREHDMEVEPGRDSPSKQVVRSQSSEHLRTMRATVARVTNECRSLLQANILAIA